MKTFSLVLFPYLKLGSTRYEVPRGFYCVTYVFHYGPFQLFLQNLWLHSLLQLRIRLSWNWFISAPKLFIKYNWPSTMSKGGRRRKKVKAVIIYHKRVLLKNPPKKRMIEVWSAWSGAEIQSSFELQLAKLLWWTHKEMAHAACLSNPYADSLFCLYYFQT